MNLDVASSLIRINEASLEQLQQLPHIGAKRAQRIVEHRETVAPLSCYADLATAAGISEKMARETHGHIDWTPPGRAMSTSLVILVFAGIAWGGLFTYALASYDAASAGPLASLYLTCVSLILLGGLALMAHQLLIHVDLPLVAPRWMMLVFLASGLILLMSLAIAIALMGRHDQFAGRINTTAELALFVVVIVTLIFGPGWHVRTFPAGFAVAASLFDTFQLMLAAAILALLSLRDQPSVIEMLFGIWAGITLLGNSRDMALGRSSYLSRLSNEDRSRLTLSTDGDTPMVLQTGSRRLTRPTGYVLAILSVALLAVSLRALILH